MRGAIALASGSGLVLALVLGHGLWAGGWRTNALTGRPILHDQIAFHAAGLACRSGECDRLYDEAVQRAFQEESLGHGHAPPSTAPPSAAPPTPALPSAAPPTPAPPSTAPPSTASSTYRPFLSPPHTAALYIPASYLPYRAFALLAAAVNLALLVAALWLAGAGRTAPVAAFGFYPVFDGFGVGQNVFASLFLFAAALRLWREGRGFRAGVVAGLVAAYKPHLLCGVGLLWVLEARRDPRPLAGMLTAVAAFAAIDAGLLLASSMAYTRLILDVLPGRPLWAGITAGGEFTVGQMFDLLFPHSARLADLLTLAALAAGAAVFVRFQKRHREDRTLSYAGALLLTLWLIPHAHRYEWTLLVLPGVLLWRELPAARARLVALYAAFYLVPAFAIRFTRLQLDALGVALHPAAPMLALGAAVVLDRLRARDV